MRHNEEIKQHAINGLVNINADSIYGCDLHNELFNRDHFIIGYHAAEEFLRKCEDGVFCAIEIIKEYEQGDFGEVSTDFSSSERVANMYAYIKGEELLNESEILRNKWDERLSEEDLMAIKSELEAI